MPAGGVLLLRAFGTDLAFRLRLPDGGSQEAAELRGAELESFLEALWGEMSGVSQAFRRVFRPFFAGFWLVFGLFLDGFGWFCEASSLAQQAPKRPRREEQSEEQVEEVVGVSEAPKCRGRGV